ncbi:glycosyltransferase [Aurantimonas aggregata]|uniref:Glycosyltransferase n=1 Tax=Aurantimonas aggregata TaxID=2047720 RepID=A0A6L9MEF8_9HYPH|nr:glycosyltransferase [Aurantimonas aggregata]NDV86041.1 glycosyltransferase [Aurantimonas aggregata]
MSHVALICPPFHSHLRVFEALGGELLRRGHRVTFLLNAGASPSAGPPGLMRRETGSRSGRDIEALLARAARPTGPLGILRTVADAAELTDELCRDGPAILTDIGADAIVGDAMEPAAGLLADHLGLPHVSLSAALPVHHDPAVPLPFLSWSYDPSERGMKRNRGGERVARLLLTRQRRTIARWADAFGLPPRDGLADCLSRGAQISQLVPSFDFPRAAAPHRHMVGPLRAGPRDAIANDDAGGGRPLVFASLGTLQGHRVDIFRAVARACRDLEIRCIVAHCGRLTPSQAARIDADLVTDFVPQEKILQSAAVCVTHAGMNTVLDSLAAGVPMLAIPIAFDQPGIAARIVHHGVGERLSRFLVSPGRVKASLARLLAEASFRDRARAIGRDIATSGGVGLAADIVEEAILGRASRIEMGRNG